ncbi:MAG TPA: helix-turn-helix transcriptional regulator [Streptosporangiaceae bacterium]|jgi:DNA-binding XRE family transcriptional regulator
MDARVHFARELRRLREQAGLTREQLGEAIGYNWETIRSIEMNRRTPKPLFARKSDEALSVHGMLIELQAATEAETTEFGSLMEVEQRATEIRIWDCRVIPGLLQTRDYAEIFVADPELVQERMDRQRIFDRNEPTEVHVVLSESSLYHIVGSPSIARAQLEHLIRPDAPWTLQIMPFTEGAHPGSAGPLMILSFEDESPIAFVDSITGGTLADDPKQVSMLSKAWDAISAAALSPSMSKELIMAVIADMPEESNDHWLA